MRLPTKFVISLLVVAPALVWAASRRGHNTKIKSNAPAKPSQGGLFVDLDPQSGMRAKAKLLTDSSLVKRFAKKLTFGSFAGRICYSADDSTTSDGYIIVSLADGSSQVCRISSTDGYGIADPLFSPTGSALCFKIGDNYEFPNYTLYYLDLKNASLRTLTTSYFQVPTTSWSRDGRYIAYIRGGNISGKHRRQEPPLALVVVNVETQKETVIESNDAVNLGFDWMPDGSLIYTSRRPFTGQDVECLIQADVISRKKKIILTHAQHPVASPDGKKLAFFGPAKVEKADDLYPSLCVYDLSSQTRMPVNLEAGVLPIVTWGQNGAIIVVSQDPESYGKVTSYDTKTLAKRFIGSYDVKVLKQNGVPVDDPSFVGLRVMKDGQLYCGINTITGKGSESYLTRQTIQVMNLNDGQVKLLTVGQQGSPFDWH
jgi:hypothetical protein